MKKLFKRGGLKYFFPIISLKMKLTFILTIVSLIQIQANSYSQTKKISLDVENITLKQVISEIEAQSEYKFLLNRKDVDLSRKVSVKVNKKLINRVLYKLFSNTNTGFEILNKQIILKKLPKKVGAISNGSNSLPDDTQAIQFAVTGVVADNDGAPLPGANVVEKGTTNGTQTDFDGNYSINVTDENAILVISYLGFSTKEVEVNGQTTISIALVEDMAGLDEVVVVGYGSQKKGEITAAIASIDGEAINKIATSSSIDAIKGQVAGVDIQSSGGRPGQGSTVRIRGRRSVNASNDPLYVVDGVPQLDASAISDIAPGDIESMQILKDAAATAIYGSRGANGVVLISTKRGKVGKTKVTYNTYYGVTSATRLVDMMDGQQFTDLRRESKRSSWDGTIPADVDVFEDPVELKSIAEGRSTNWLDQVLGNGWQTNHQVGVSGGSENTTFNASMGYFGEQGIVSNMDYERFSGRINLDHRINDTFKVGLSFVITNSTQNWGSNAAIGESLAINPLGVPYDVDGNLLFLPTNDGIRTNPLSELVDGAYVDERKVTRVLAPIYLDINLAKGLQWKTTFGPDLRFQKKRSFYGKSNQLKQRWAR